VIFLKDNLVILGLIFFTIVSEVFHLLFVGISFNENVNLDAPVYYLTSQFGLTNFLPALIIFFFINDINKASKCMAFGLVVWNIKELVDEICYMSGINTNVFEINSSFWGQIVFILAIISFSAYGYSKWKY
jgi:hypothetical protein